MRPKSIRPVYTRLVNLVYSTCPFGIPVLLILFLTCFGTKASGQYRRARISYLSLNDGLSLSFVFFFFFVFFGFLWFATDDGLNKYDGYNFTVFKHEPKNSHSLKVNNIGVIAEDADKNLWIGTGGGGLSLYDRNTDSFINLSADKNNPSALSNDDITSFYQDAEGNVWFGAYSGLNLYDKKSRKFKHFFYEKDQDYVLEHHIYAITGDGRGNLLLGTQGGLICFNHHNGKYKRYVNVGPGNKSLISNNIHAVLRARSNRVWIATDKGMDEFDENAGTFVHHVHNAANQSSIADNNVLSMADAGNGKMWIGTEKGLDLFDENTGSCTHYKDDQVQDRSISCILDIDGILWLGVFDEGIMRYDSIISSFAHYSHQKGLPSQLNNKNVNAFSETGKGYWIGTDGGGLNFLDKNTHAITSEALPVGKVILTLLRDGKRRLWVGSYGNGIDVIDDEGKHIAHYGAGTRQNDISNNDVFALMEDTEGNIWAGIDDGGVNVISNGRVVKRFGYNKADTIHCLSNNDIRTIYRDHENNIWIGTFDGLNRYNANGTFTHYKVYNSGLTNNTISAIFEDSNHNLWVGTLGGGLDLYNKKTGRFSAYQLPDASAYAMVYSIVEDRNQFLWIGTGNGLLWFFFGFFFFW